MIVKIKKTLPNGKIPKYQSEGAACFDLHAAAYEVINDGKQIKYDIGLAFEIPEGYVGIIVPRSSIVKSKLRLANSLGIIDHDYRGNISFIFDIMNNESYDKIERINTYLIGERIGQMMIIPYPKIDFLEVEELTQTKRGKGGYGSTGLK